MGNSKRKRVSMDSAIADMSGEGSTSTASNTQGDTQHEHVPRSQHMDRISSGHFTDTLGFSFLDFGTAASQRSRREAASRTAPPPPTFEEPPQKRRRVVKDISHNMPAAGASQKQKPVEDVVPPAPASEVKGKPVEREQTPEQIHAGLPSPPPTLVRTIFESPPQLSLRRSARDRRPTKRLQESSIEEPSPCKEKSRTKTVGVTESRKETNDNCKSCIVRLRVPLAAIVQQQGASMSLAGSFSHRSKVGDSDLKESQVSEKEVSGCTYWCRTTADE